MALSKAQKRRAARADNLAKLEPLVRVLEEMAPGGGKALREVLIDLHDIADEPAPKAKAKTK